MTKVIEGPVVKLIRWDDDKGGNVELHQDNAKYYFDGKMDIPLGPTCKFEVKHGEGKHVGEYEIISCEKLKENPANLPPQPAGMPHPQAGNMVTMPFNDFQNLLMQKKALVESKVRALDAAAKAYAGMGKQEKDPKAAARDVIDMARELEGFLR